MNTLPTSLVVRLQTSWRDVIDAERQRGLALAGGADILEVAAAQLAYEQALDRFRHTQIELFTVAIGNLELVREQIEVLSVVIGEMKQIIEGRTT